MDPIDSDVEKSIAKLYGFFLNSKWRLVSRWRFCHFKITLYSKNPLQATTSSKIKILMDSQRTYTQKK
jgi:hypothetical protein